MKFQVKTRNPKGFPHPKAVGWLVQLLAQMSGGEEELLAAAAVVSWCPSHPSGSPVRRWSSSSSSGMHGPLTPSNSRSSNAWVQHTTLPKPPTPPQLGLGRILAGSSCFACCSSESRELLVQEARLRFTGESRSRSCLGAFLPDGADAFQETGRC